MFSRNTGGDARERLEIERAQSRADAKALDEVMTALDGAADSDALLRIAMDVARKHFGWRYGSAWRLDPMAQELVFAGESGDPGAEFSAHSHQVRFAQGQGLPGVCWQRAELIVIPDLAQDSSGLDLRAIERAGLNSALAFPLINEGSVTGAIEFFDDSVGAPSQQRLTVLRTVGLLISHSFARLAERESRREHDKDIAAMTTVVRQVADAPDAERAMGAALETIRDTFDWEYASFWKLDHDTDTLVFAQESGDAGGEFREVTRAASFAKGVGVAGRTWERGDLVEVPDLGAVTDCVRAPAARRAGVKSGVCLPVMVGGTIVGTLDFFVMRFEHLTESRRTALQNTAFMVGQALERFSASMHLDSVAQNLFDSIREVQTNVEAASSVAARGRELSESTNARIAALSRASAEIGKVVHVIQEIAAQTNLLALNATIEAARAGDAGKGFAVVAGEVKDLAAETARATTQVESKVTAIGTEVAAITEALEAIGRAVDDINDSQGSIGTVVEQQVATVRSVVTAGVEQAA